MTGEGPGSVLAGGLVRLPEDVILETLARVHGVAETEPSFWRRTAAPSPASSARSGTTTGKVRRS